MKKTYLLAAAALGVIAAPLAAQSATTFSPQRLSQHVQVLGSDAYEGRGPATRAETKTVDYITNQFRAAGLKPGGDVVNGQRQWTQAVPLLRSEIVGTPHLEFHTAAGAQPLTQGEQIAVRAPMNGQNQIALTDAPLVFVGYGVTAPERQWDDFGGKFMTYYGRWTYKYEEGARRGAAGVLVVHETDPASYGWNTVKNSNTNAMFDIVRQDPAATHSPLEGWIQRDTAVALFRAAGLDFEAAKQAAKRRDFQPVDLKASLTAHVNAKAETITSRNVVGMLPGKRYPEETVIYTAHWDHLGIGRPDANGDTIYNGALDNATGISQLIEQGRAFAREPRTDRTLVFMAVTAEEKGLLGSAYYAANPLFPLGKTVGVINTDSLGVWGPTRNFSISGTAKLGLLDDLIAVARTQNRSFAPDPHPEAGGFFRSDHFPMAKVGVPAISFDSGNDLVTGGVARGEQIGKEYVERAYHQPDDEFSSTWDFRGMANDAALLHELGLRLANSREWPNWSADSEFRATRDQSASERGETAVPAEPVPAPSKGERG